MACCYLKEMTVPVPWGKGPVVIRKGRTVEFQLDRTYLPGSKSSRVRRKTIGRLDPANRGRMFPNENYFHLFPENEVPEEIREAFLDRCAMKRDMARVRKDPEELARRLAAGLQMIKEEGEAIAMENNEAKDAKTNEWTIRNPRDYFIMLEMFDKVYAYIDELAEKNPNEVMDAYKVKLINEILEEIRACLYEENLCVFLRLIDEPGEEKDGKGKAVPAGMTYSDVMLLLKWYKSMPR